MTCPDPSDLEACTNDVPCDPCPHARVAVGEGVVWAYSREPGWHEPARKDVTDE